MEDRMTLDQFLVRAEADVQAFGAAVRTAQAEEADGFTGRFLHRTREEWWREVAVYYDYSEFMNTIGQ